MTARGIVDILVLCRAVVDDQGQSQEQGQDEAVSPLAQDRREWLHDREDVWITITDRNI